MYAQILLAVSFAIASYQDVKDRAVSDIVWIPAAAGLGLIVYTLYANSQFLLLEFEVLKVALFGGMAFFLVYTGRLGEADLIGMVFFVADPYPAELLLALVGSLLVIVPHLTYLFATGNASGSKVIPVDRFLKEQKWVPKATIVGGVRTEVSPDVNDAREEVESRKQEGMEVVVTFGTPTLAYLGIGYIAYVIYLVVFNTPAFVSLP